MNGIINVYKPSGCTSQHVVSAIRRIFHTRDVGHMGTLDPQGEGVLPIGIGKSTRLFDILLNKDKVYEATFKFGYETDTLDKDGKILSCCELIPTREQIEAVLGEFVGKFDQMPPRYSAKNINGKRAYDLARAGIDFELKTARIEIFSLKLLSCTSVNEYLFSIHCSSGTYIRSICRDIAERLGTKATMTSIKRVRSGNFLISDAHTLDEIELMGESAIISPQMVLKDLPRVDFSTDYYKQISCGIEFVYTYEQGVPFTVYCQGEFFGIGMINDEGKFKIKTYLRD